LNELSTALIGVLLNTIEEFMKNKNLTNTLFCLIKGWFTTFTPVKGSSLKVIYLD